MEAGHRASGNSCCAQHADTRTFRVAYLITHDATEAEDAAQEAFAGAAAVSRVAASAAVAVEEAGGILRHPLRADGERLRPLRLPTGPDLLPAQMTRPSPRCVALTTAAAAVLVAAPSTSAHLHQSGDFFASAPWGADATGKPGTVLRITAR